MMKKSKAVLGLSILTPAAKVIRAQSYLDAMQASGNFPASHMPISYPNLQTLVTNLHNAVQQADQGTSTDISDMHEQERILVMAFNLVKAHVEMTANTFTNADAIILSSGMSVSQGSGQYAITDLTLEAAGQGTISIRVPKQDGERSYWFQYSLANDPNNWQTIGYSSLTRYSFSGQTPGTNLNIRYAPITKSGLGAFSAAKQVMVV